MHIHTLKIVLWKFNQFTMAWQNSHTKHKLLVEVKILDNHFLVKITQGKVFVMACQRNE